MAQTGYTPILVYASGTATNVPLAINLTSSALGAELALNYADGKLYYKNSSGTVTLLASAAGSLGDVVGPASATDNALARFDLTTGKLIQNSVGILSDTGALSGITDIAASGSITLSGGTANGVAYLNGSKVLTTGSALVFDGSNLGVGVTPSAWSTDFKAIQVGAGAAFWGPNLSTIPYAYMSSNQLYDSGNTSRYINNGFASWYIQQAGTHIWSTAPSGTAGNPITFTQAMTLDASGNLLVGTTSTGALDGIFGAVVGGSSRSTGGVAVECSNSQWVAYTNTDQAYIFYDSRQNLERARIDSSGNLLVGTTTINKLGSGAGGPGFQIATSGGAEIYLSTSATASGEFVGAVNFGTTGTSSATKRSALIGSLLTATSSSVVSGNLVFYTTNAGTLAEAARIDSGGALLIGTTTSIRPTGFQVFKEEISANTQGLFIGNVPQNFTAVTTKPQSGITQYFPGYFLNNIEVVVGFIQSTTTATTYSTSSDYRLKNTIAPMTGALAKVALLKPCTYKWNADGTDGQGFIAHELQEVYPQAVSGEKDAVNEDGKPVHQGVDYGKITPLLTAALQEAIAKIELLEARLASLESK